MSHPFSKIRALLTFCIACLASFTHAQDSTLYYKASLTGAGATAQTPFWQYANQNGSVPMNGYFGMVDAGFYKVYNPNNPRLFQWSAGIQAIASYGRSENVFLSDLYVAAKLGRVEILAGQKRMTAGLADTTLSSGPLAMAGNARPHPRFQIAIPEYFPLYFTNNFVAIKFTYSDGYLGGSRVNFGSVPKVSSTYLHQKQIYFRLGGKSHRYRIHLGANHQAIWGGEEELMPLYKLKMPKAYWYTISGKTLDYRKVGNHFGTFDIGGEWHGRKWNFFLYRQNIYETGSLFRVSNFEDGLNGLSIKRAKPLPKGSSYFAFHSFLLEVVGTHNQLNRYPISELVLFGKSNYFNSYVYQRGWAYYGSGIGTPLAPASATTDTGLPRNNSEFTNNNRFWAFHTGATATWLNLKLAFRGTYSRNSGTFLSPFEDVKQQVSLLLSAEKNLNILKGCSVYSALSSDIGELYPNTYGLTIGLRKSGFLD
ncbi:capsule assembly Wzi family protein [Dyadobacter sp. CY261]|uniref:capsule assembly Wzi family protein n=1 Tax=Dyadobacter sp. CY261 TaxID=2907203 RepID=UPI001F1AFE99|nr:capsule assembly Wzi family protein [Dyadobacter sp. CY261]MCF0075252.1 capsule assembly Wzi family protein [Dyadobacter sp. CY261]